MVVSLRGKRALINLSAAAVFRLSTPPHTFRRRIGGVRNNVIYDPFVDMYSKRTKEESVNEIFFLLYQGTITI